MLRSLWRYLWPPVPGAPIKRKRLFAVDVQHEPEVARALAQREKRRKARAERQAKAADDAWLAERIADYERRVAWVGVTGGLPDPKELKEIHAEYRNKRMLSSIRTGHFDFTYKCYKADAERW